MEKKVFLPANLDLDTHLQNYPPTNVERFEKDKLVYLLSLLISIPANNKKLSKQNGPWVPLYSVLLKQYIGNDYSSYVNYALGKPYLDCAEARIIETDNSYKVGLSSKRFRFTVSYSSHGNIKEVPITLKVLLRKFADKWNEQRRVVNSLYPHLVKWFDFNKLKLDAVNAREYAGLLLEWENMKHGDWLINKVFIKSEPLTSKERKQIDELPDNAKQRINYLTNISRLETGDYFIGVDDNVHRFHSNLTNLKSELRYFLTYDGKQLVSIDIVNSQPFLSMALFDSRFLEYLGTRALPAREKPADFTELSSKLNENDKSADEENIDLDEAFVSLSGLDIEIGTEGTTNPISRRSTDSFKISQVAPTLHRLLKSKTIAKAPLDRLLNGQNLPLSEGEVKSYYTLLDSLIMFTKSLNSTNNEDIVQYISDVTSGRFYEAFRDLLQREGITEIRTRGEAKIAIYLILFTSNQFINSEEAAPKRLFRKVYPTVYDYFSMLKRGDKTVLARLLQSIESWLVLDQACERISQQRPEVPLFTIHDSIVTTVENQQYVSEVMANVIKHYVGYIPNLAIKVYDPRTLPSTYEEYIAS